jgi:hypothetical protein
MQCDLLRIRGTRQITSSIPLRIACSVCGLPKSARMRTECLNIHLATLSPMSEFGDNFEVA